MCTGLFRLSWYPLSIDVTRSSSTCTLTVSSSVYSSSSLSPLLELLSLELSLEHNTGLELSRGSTKELPERTLLELERELLDSSLLEREELERILFEIGLEIGLEGELEIQLELGLELLVKELEIQLERRLELFVKGLEM